MGVHAGGRVVPLRCYITSGGTRGARQNRCAVPHKLNTGDEEAKSEIDE